MTQKIVAICCIPYRNQSFDLHCKLSKYNPMQNAFKKIKKKSKVKQDLKTLVSVFLHVLSVSTKNLYQQGRLGIRLCPHAVLRFL